MKKTDDLYKELGEKRSIDEYFAENSGELLFDSISDLLIYKIAEKNLSKIDVISRSGIEKHYGYQILNGTKNPSRDKLLMLGFGIGLDIGEINHLLRKCGYGELYPRDARDSVIAFALIHRMDVISANELLYEKHLRLLE